ncbi:ketoacid CoA transferase [Thalassotalea ponticola]|uniref:CoA-transferase subunit beta n=1 Tax=Thalassotalea ponticola TaxID=1523392 RepID=UPI0025B4D94B|nr:ketoacid CoA transferase [Thalassotalea ponticola]MDN3653818.1 ketoacid CoA transferase [Thalassotalea ponticola]
MTVETQQFTLAELMICAAAEAFRNDGENLATGIGVLPRLAASLAKQTFNPDLMMTDSEAYMLAQPNPLGKRDGAFVQANESWMGFARIFDNVWSGKRHAMIGPTQIDRFGQTNISAIGNDYQQPKIQMLGVRGLPGNSISHANSFFVPNHNKKVFVEGECDVVCSIGYNPERLPKGYSFDDIDIRLVITNLCVMDWNGPNKQLRVISLHPGVTFEQVQENTSFALCKIADLGETAHPTAEQLAIIRQFDPHNQRAMQIKGNPDGLAASVQG